MPFLMILFLGATMVFSAVLVVYMAAWVAKRQAIESQQTIGSLLWMWCRYIVYIIVTLFLIGLGIVIAPGAGLVLLFFLPGMLLHYAMVVRNSRAMCVVSTIGASMRQNLPLSLALASAATGRNDQTSLTLGRIAHWLTEGYKLSEAIERGYKHCPGSVIAMITAGERIGQLPGALKVIEQELAEKGSEHRKVQPVNPGYPLVVIVFAVTITSGLMVFVLPSFQAIFADMGVELPLITRALLRFADMFGGVLSSLLMICTFIILPVAVSLKFRPRRPSRPYSTSVLGDLLKWHLPILHWFERNYSVYRTVAFLKLSLKSGSTVDDAIAGAAELDVNLCYRKRLRNWLARVRQGQGITEAARDCRVGVNIAWAFDQQVNKGNTLGTLEMLESAYRSNYSYVVNLARFILWPFVTLGLALMVATIVYAMFAPLVALIEHTILMSAP